MQRSCVLMLERRTRESNEQSYYIPVHDIPGLIMRMCVARSPPAPGQEWWTASDCGTFSSGTFSPAHSATYLTDVSIP